MYAHGIRIGVRLRTMASEAIAATSCARNGVTNMIEVTRNYFLFWARGVHMWTDGPRVNLLFILKRERFETFPMSTEIRNGQGTWTC